MVRGLNPGGGRDFQHPSWGLPSLLYNRYRVISGVKRPGRGVDHPPPSSTEVKERLQLYLYSPSEPSWPVLGWTYLFIDYFQAFITSPSTATLRTTLRPIRLYLDTWDTTHVTETLEDLLFAGLMARREHPEGPATGHLDTGFLGFPQCSRSLVLPMHASHVALSI